jgi:hypothetical protein
MVVTSDFTKVNPFAEAIAPWNGRKASAQMLRVARSVIDPRKIPRQNFEDNPDAVYG